MRTTESYFILAALFVTPLSGCASDHLLGAMPSPDLQDANEADQSTAAARQDFILSPELAPPDLALENMGFKPFPAGMATSIGDVDGDGFDDFATSVWHSLGGDRLRNIRIRYGRPRPANEVEAFDWEESGARLIVDPDGFSTIHPLGDLDADGYADFFVNVGPCYRQEQLAYLIYGSAQRHSGVSRLADAAVALKGPQRPGPANQAGCSGAPSTYAHDLASGDFNGDGYDDFVLTDFDELVIVSGRPEITEQYTGGTYLFYGGPQRIVSGTSWTEADVKLDAPSNVELTGAGDMNGDGLADLLIRGYDLESFYVDGRLYWLPGQAQRLPRYVDLQAAERATGITEVKSAGDLDGDGRSDVLLYAEDAVPHLFYGATAVFAAPVALGDADATLNAAPYVELLPIPDRDGDGDDELVANLPLVEFFAETPPRFLALHSGSSVRARGSIQLHEPTNPLRGTDSLIEQVLPVGDLDGDGAGDLLTRSQRFRFPADENGELVVPARDAYEHWHASAHEVYLNIHYGTPGGTAVQPVR